MNFLIRSTLFGLLSPYLAWGQYQFNDRLNSELTALFESSEVVSGRWGCSISDVNSGEDLYVFNPLTPLIPASNQKLLVIAAALLKAGLKYKSRTHFLADGPIEDGRLNGNLIVCGYGAIHFTTRFAANRSLPEKSAELDKILDQFAQRFRRVGIEEITGNLLVDCSDWTDTPVNAHYPAAAPLSFYENTVDVEVSNGIIRTCPKRLIGFNIENKIWRGTQKKIIKNGNMTDTIWVNLEKNSSDYWRLDQYVPATYYQRHITQALADRGITIRGTPTQSKDIHDRYSLFYVESLPLHELLTEMGKHSDNFRAETIFLNLGYLVKGKANYKNAAQALMKILHSSGIRLNNVSTVDGSGLSRNNRISAEAMIRLLNFMVKTPYKDHFIRCLPVSGESGTLKTRLSKNGLKGRVTAKTGTLSDVTALSGYILKQSEPALSFSFICNEHHNKNGFWSVMERVLETLVKKVDNT